MWLQRDVNENSHKNWRDPCPSPAPGWFRGTPNGMLDHKTRSADRFSGLLRSCHTRYFGKFLCPQEWVSRNDYMVA